jgi:hypothetical protein
MSPGGANPGSSAGRGGLGAVGRTVLVVLMVALAAAFIFFTLPMPKGPSREMKAFRKKPDMMIQILSRWPKVEGSIDWQAVQQEVSRTDAGIELIVTNDWGEDFTASNRFVVNTNASGDRLVKCGVYSGYRLWLSDRYQYVFEKDAR